MFNLDNAVVYDIETTRNCFTLATELLNSDQTALWEISPYRDDRAGLFTWFTHLAQQQIAMIGFYSEHFDYPVIHWLFHNPQATYSQIYDKAQEIIASDNRFAHTIWPRDRFTPQIDLFKIHHFDNKAKTTSLKSLQINMRCDRVVDSPVDFKSDLTFEQIERDLKPYNKHDVRTTKQFAHISRPAIDFRIGLIDQFGIEALNYNDTKIGEKMLEQRLGDDICYDRSSGRKAKRQTPRHKIALADIIFPYIQFNNPEFVRILDFMKAQVLTPEDIENSEDEPSTDIKTKGVFKNLIANVGGLDFYFGTGGVHASVTAQRFTAGDGYIIRDIDVEGLYPRVAIVNRLAPAHLGEAFISEYGKIPTERKTHAKGTYQNAALKLAANGAWGKSNSKFSIFYDPQYAMTIPINGQLMICMLAEWLLAVPTLQIIQANTDGITYFIHENYEPQAVEICKRWQEYTCLILEDANYSRMWIRDVNNYLAEDTKGKLKQKGAYWYPDPMNYEESISKASPPCWYKDLGNIISKRAAVMAMVYGVEPDALIRAHTNPFDFMCRVKADRQSKLYLGSQQIQNTTRYYVSKEGAPLTKISPPNGPLGEYKRRNGLSNQEFNRIAATLQPGEWSELIHTKNKSKYEERVTAIEAGWKVAECNDAASFDFANLNYDWYLREAVKLIIP